MKHLGLKILPFAILLANCDNGDDEQDENASDPQDTQSKKILKIQNKVKILNQMIHKQVTIQKKLPLRNLKRQWKRLQKN